VLGWIGIYLSMTTRTLGIMASIGGQRYPPMYGEHCGGVWLDLGFVLCLLVL
jgi:hypothetical protein